MRDFPEIVYEDTGRKNTAQIVRPGKVLPRHMVCLFLVALLLSASHAYAHPWRVVILPGADPSLPAAFEQIQTLRSALSAAAPDGVDFYTDSLDGLRFDSAALMPDFLALMRRKYEHRQVDIVIGLADFALEFTRKYHAEIWPGVPVVISSIEDRRLVGLPPDFAHVPMRLDIDGTLAVAESLQPDAHRLVVVGGVSEFDRDGADRAAAVAAQRTTHKWRVEVWRGLSLPELRQRLATLDRHSAVLYAGMFRDREGRTYFPYEVVGPMAEVSGAPIYSWYPTYLPYGLTGGSVISFRKNGQITGELAASILLGKQAAPGAMTSMGASHCVANVARLEKLGLRTDSLPPDCELIDVPPSIWRQYRGAVVLALAVLAMQALTIAALLWQRRGRHIAEDEATLRRAELARAARFAAAGELSASIAHEVGQPLGAILSNADAASMMIDKPEPNLEELHAILADVRRDALRANEVVQRLRALLQKQSVAFGPVGIDDAVAETLALLGPESRRRNVTIEASLDAGGIQLQGDRIQLQQVLLNLAINALDAMQQTPPSARILSISTRKSGNGLEITVADRGHGIPAGEKTRLFESLYTTKPHGMGLGLSIVRTIVEAHRGRVTVADRDGGGSIFRVWLPERGTPAHAENRRASSHDAAETNLTQQHPTIQGGRL